MPDTFLPRNLIRVLSFSSNHLLFAILFTLMCFFAKPAAAQMDCTTGSTTTFVQHGSAAHPYVCKIFVQLNADKSADVTIVQPVDDQPLTTYTPIQFHSNDKITVTADGCANMGGRAFTSGKWRRYVNPNPPGVNEINKGDALYLGVLSINSATGSLGVQLSSTTIYPNGHTNMVSFEELLLEDMNGNPTSPSGDPNNKIGIDLPSAFPDDIPAIGLKIGYTDDDYSDDGYYDQDDGGGQCTTNDPSQSNAPNPSVRGSNPAPTGTWGGPAWVNFHVEPGEGMTVVHPVPLPFDMVWLDSDFNGFALNPAWGWQVSPATQLLEDEEGSTGGFLEGQFVPFGGTPGGELGFYETDAPGVSLLPSSSLEPSYNLYNGPWLEGTTNLSNGLVPQPLCNWEPTNNITDAISGGFAGGAPNIIGNGHINIMQATFTGYLTGPVDFSIGTLQDHDVNINLDDSSAETQYSPTLFDPPAATGGDTTQADTTTYPNHTTIHSEFNADETVNNWFPFPPGQPPMDLCNILSPPSYWCQTAALFAEVATKQSTIDGQPNPLLLSLFAGHQAVISGVLGLDAVHPTTYPELHPVQGIAIKETADVNSEGVQLMTDTGDDEWAVFARQTGNEGNCSNRLDTVDFNNNEYVIRIPPPYFLLNEDQQLVPGATASLGPNTLLSFALAQGQTVPAGKANFVFRPATATAQAGAFLTLPVPSSNGSKFVAVFGDVEVKWSCSGTSCPSPGQSSEMKKRNVHPEVAPGTGTDGDEDEEPEGFLASVTGAMTPAQMATYNTVYNELYPPPPPAVITQVKVKVVTKAPKRSDIMPQIIQTLDPEAGMMQEAGMEAACVGTGGNVPYMPTACAAAPPVTTLSITNSATPGGAAPPQDSLGWDIAPVYVRPIAASASGYPIADTYLTIIPGGAAPESFTYSTPPTEGVPLGLDRNSISYASIDTANHAEALNYKTINVAPQVSFVGADLTTQGSWEGVYGGKARRSSMPA